MTSGHGCLRVRDRAANTRATKQTELGLNLTTKRTRKREFLAQMERVVPWATLLQLVAPHAPEGKKGQLPFSVETDAARALHAREKGLMLKVGTMVDATLIVAPSSTKNASGERDPEIKQSKKGHQ